MTSGTGGNYGEPIKYDPNFHGPQKKRNCTDVICLGVFFFFLVIWGFAGYYASREGKFENVLVPTDSNHLQCGIDSQVKDKPYLFFFDITKCVNPAVAFTGCSTPQICVEKCPNNLFFADKSHCNSGNFKEIKRNLICKPDFPKDSIKSCDNIEDAFKADHCAQWYLPSDPISHRCIPGVASIDKLPEIINKNDLVKALRNMGILAEADLFGQNVVEDVKNSWQVIAVSIGIAAFACFILIAIMRFVACPVVWFSIIGLLCLMGYGIYFSYQNYNYTKMNPPLRPEYDLNLQSLVTSRFDYSETWIVILVILSIVFLITFLLVLFLRKRIVIAIALIKEGSKAVAANMSTLVFPIVPWILQILVIVYGVYVMALLTSIGKPEYKIADYRADKTKDGYNCVCSGTGNYSIGDLCSTDDFNKNCKDRSSGQTCSDMACIFIKLKKPDLVHFFQGLNVVGFFWLLFFITAFSEMVLAGVFATWYWTKRSNRPFFSLTTSILRTIRFHLGTLAFGSLIITICRIIRLFLEYIDQKLKKFNNGFVNGILCLCKCCFWCLENFMKFVNKNAYIMTAIHGTSFCASARNSFNLLMRNVLRAFALDKVSGFLFFLSKAFVSLGMAASLYTYLGTEHFSQLGIQLHYKWLPCTIVGIVTFMIASVFYGVYSMSVDTLFLCFLEDSERNDGSVERPYAMSKNLRNILGVRNKNNAR